MELGIEFTKMEGEAVKFDKTEGIEIGDIPSGGLNATLSIMCTNDTIKTPEMAVQLNMGVNAHLNASWDNFVINLSIPETQILHSKVMYDGVGLEYHNYDRLF